MSLNSKARARIAVLVAVPALVAGGLLAAGVPAAYAAPNCSAATIAANINEVTSVAGDLSSLLGGLSQNASPSQVQAASEATSTGLNTMISDLSADAADLSGCALNAADSQTVASAFSDLGSVTQQLLSTLTGKHVVFAQFGRTAPIANSLRGLESVSDSYASALASAAPSQASAIANVQDSVDNSLGNTITVYQQLCIPSPLYPDLPPICITL